MKILKTTLVLTLMLIFAPTITNAQDNTVYTVTTWKINIPEDGTQEEFNTLLKEFNDKVILPNEKIISQRAMRHLSGSDSRDLIFITEYANWNDIDASGTRQNELMKSAWKSEDANKAFFEKFNKYFLMHTDEIYSSIKVLDKE
ncbi:hypothetical protein [Psychroserpens mesophilus]|uniref:hypothetical protein n=1 Tax=Psychroserpens mesophilus TaxID=325473 RepID=UPI003D656F65